MSVDMNGGWIFILGFALMLVLGVLIVRRLARDFRRRPGASIQTVALVWASPRFIPPSWCSPP
jgi:hypothetical protein